MGQGRQDRRDPAGVEGERYGDHRRAAAQRPGRDLRDSRHAVRFRGPPGARAAEADRGPRRRRRGSRARRERQHGRVLRPDDQGSGNDGPRRRGAGRAPMRADRRRRPEHQRRLRARQGLARGRGRRAHGPPAARSVRFAARRGELHPADRRRSRRPADHALPPPRRHRPRRDREALRRSRRGGREVGVSDAAPARGGDPPLQPGHRLGRRPGRAMGAALVRGRRPRIHVGAHQRLARTLRRHPCRARSGRFRPGAPPDRRHGPVRGPARGGAERDQRHGREGRPAADGRGLRSDTPALRVAADGSAAAEAARPARGVGRDGSTAAASG